MQFVPSEISGVFTIELDKRGDDRGFFARAFCTEELSNAGLETDIQQINNSVTAEKAVLRGLHFQRPPHAEVKIVRCVSGAIWDVVVDIREGSPTFGKWFGTDLTAENRTMMYVPKGFAHGFVTLTEHAEIIYFVSSKYAPQAEGGLRWDDSRLAIDWPLRPSSMSTKDESWPLLDDDFVAIAV